MIEFLTLFLGLVGGPQRVELDAAPAVAAIELRLDGASVARRDEPPWRFDVDFGTELLPRELVAVAFDASGVELARARQTLNLPRPPAEVRLLVDASGEAGPVVRTAWETSAGAEPTAASAYLDGEPLLLEGPTPTAQISEFPLPDLDAGSSRLLEVDLAFGPALNASAHVVLGLGSGIETSAELTAVPMDGARRRQADDMDGWFRRTDGAPLEVVAVEKGRGDLVVVRGPGVASELALLQGMPEGGLDAVLYPPSRKAGRTPGASASVPGGPTLDSSGLTFSRGTTSLDFGPREALISALAVPDEIRLRALLARAERVEGRALQLDRFPLSPEVTRDMGGLPLVLGRPLDAANEGELRVWDAVALAGLGASAANRRRAVVLVLASRNGSGDAAEREPMQDHSRFPESAVRGYLDALRVPLEVWVLESGESGGSGVGGGSEFVEGDHETFRKFAELRSAVRSLRKDLENQRIVWLRGVHLPHAVETTADAKATQAGTK